MRSQNIQFPNTLVPRDIAPVEARLALWYSLRLTKRFDGGEGKKNDSFKRITGIVCITILVRTRTTLQQHRQMFSDDC